MSFFQFCGLIFSVDAVMCLRPVAASFFTSFSGLSFRKGIIGSIRTVVGMRLWMSVSAASIRWDEDGAFGSISRAVASSSVVIVIETVVGTFFSRSMSLTMVVDLVTICNLQLLLVTSISRHFLVMRSCRSRLGYGSDEFDIEMISPLSFVASLLRSVMRFFFGRHLEKLGM